MSSQKVLIKGLKKNISLKNRTSFRIGGRAAYWYEPKTRNELSCFLKKSQFLKPFFVIGAGSNLLVKEGVIKKTFIHLSAQAFKKITMRGVSVEVGAGVPLNRLISFLMPFDLTGFEFLTGIPGTVGGALVMNAGAKNEAGDNQVLKEISDIVSWVEVLDLNGRIFKLKKKDIIFSYRTSSLKPYVILRAEFRLRRGEKGSARKRIKELFEERRARQDWRYASAGSFFKNPKNGLSAGRMIDSCHLKGLRYKGAQVSERHANFILNIRGAKSQDVIRLMEIIQKKVYNRFKIKLIPEVEIVA
jgi:UDP-N-acetylmuramate dehydrogenase